MQSSLPIKLWNYKLILFPSAIKPTFRVYTNIVEILVDVKVAS